MRISGMLKRLGGFCAAGAVLLLLGGCGERADDMQVVTEGGNDSISYDYVAVARGDVKLTQKISCTYRQQKEQEVSFALTGRLVDKVNVEEGDMVKKGDVLAELSAGSLERQIEDLEYQISRNELLLAHAEKNEALDISQAWVDYIYNGAYGSEKGVKDYVAAIQKNYRYQREDSADALDLDRQTLENLKREFRNCRVYADMDGMVYKLESGLEGSTSKAEKVIMYVVDNSRCLFETEAPEYADCFAEGVEVSMNINVGNAAGVYTLLPYHISEWGDVQQFSVVDGPMTSGIEVGTNGTIFFNIESRENVLYLPQGIVYTADGRHYVYVEGEGGTRDIKWVETGLTGDDRVEITSGLSEGEKVIRK